VVGLPDLLELERSGWPTTDNRSLGAYCASVGVLKVESVTRRTLVRQGSRSCYVQRAAFRAARFNGDELATQPVGDQQSPVALDIQVLDIVEQSAATADEE